MENLPFSFSLISFGWHCHCDYHRAHSHVNILILTQEHCICCVLQPLFVYIYVSCSIPVSQSYPFSCSLFLGTCFACHWCGKSNQVSRIETFFFKLKNIILHHRSQYASHICIHHHFNVQNAIRIFASNNLLNTSKYCSRDCGFTLYTETSTSLLDFYSLFVIPFLFICFFFVGINLYINIFKYTINHLPAKMLPMDVHTNEIEWANMVRTGKKMSSVKISLS